MIHETFECDRCHVQQARADAGKANWAAVWREYTFTVPIAPRQANKEIKVLCCPRCADFLEANAYRFVTDAGKDAVIAALFKP